MARKLRDPYFELKSRLDYFANDLGGLFESISYLKGEIGLLRQQLTDWHGIMDEYAAKFAEDNPPAVKNPKHESPD